MKAPLPDSHDVERLFVSTTPGLEPALEQEVRRLGLGVWRLPGGVEVEGAPGLYRALNLHLRTASRVLSRLGSFEAKDPATLEAGLRRIRLDRFHAGGPVRLHVTTQRSKLGHAGRIRDVAASAWRVKAEEASSEEEEDAGETSLRIQLRMDADVCTVSVDTSGGLLYRRGYRQEVSRAPLRETLAAGMLELAGYRGDEPLWDPMCGSGTIVIEAAWIALRRAPGLDRSFAFERFPTHDAAAWEEEKAKARAAQREKPPALLRGTDLNAGALGTARRNGRRAGVVEHLSLERQDVTKVTALPAERNGLLITNPPYGIRVGEEKELVPLFGALGALLRERLPGWRGAILLPHPRYEKALGLEIDDAFEVQNGGIRCRLLLTRPARS